MSQTITTIDAILKELYTGQKVVSLSYTNRPLMGLLPKKEDFVGRNYPLPISIAGGNAVGATFATAQGQTTPTNYKEFLLTRTNYHGFATIDNEAILASKSDKGAFVAGLTNEIDQAINKVSNDVEAYLFGTNGILGQFDSALTTAASTTGTLADPSAIVNFEVGDVLGLVPATGSAERASGLTVTRVDRDAGTLFFSANINSVFGLNSDYLTKIGSYGLVARGLRDWLPATAPAVGGASFYGVDRSVDPTRLAGVRVNGASLGTITETINKAVQRLLREGGDPDTCFMNPEDLERLLNEMGSQRMYVDVKGDGSILFKGVQVMTPNGPVKVVVAPKCQKGTSYLLTMKTWVLATLGKPVSIVQTDGLMVQRQAAGDGVEARIAFRGALGCRAPGHNAVITLPTA